jgi:hypothetical protein
MATSQTKTSVSLESACSLASEKLAKSEFLIDRHAINKGNDYIDILISAKWVPKFSTISIEVLFLVSSSQKDSMQSNIDDEGIKDDIDSGAGEAFEDALRTLHPKFDWSYTVGEVKIKCKKVK